MVSLDQMDVKKSFIQDIIICIHCISVICIRKLSLLNYPIFLNFFLHLILVLLELHTESSLHSDHIIKLFLAYTASGFACYSRGRRKKSYISKAQIKEKAVLEFLFLNICLDTCKECLCVRYVWSWVKLPPQSKTNRKVFWYLKASQIYCD